MEQSPQTAKCLSSELSSELSVSVRRPTVPDPAGNTEAEAEAEAKAIHHEAQSIVIDQPPLVMQGLSLVHEARAALPLQRRPVNGFASAMPR